MKTPKRRELSLDWPPDFCGACGQTGKTRAEERLLKAALRWEQNTQDGTAGIGRAARAVAREREKARKP